MENQDTTPLGRAIDQIEETVIAVLLGLMTIVTFANVITRYVFNSNLLWALEVTVFLFAWLVLIGTSYCVKKNLHLGVDVAVNMFGPKGRKVMAMIAVSLCILFSVLLLYGSWDYWYPFVTKQAFLETEDVPMPDFLQFLSVWLNDGERYEKMPRFIPYFALPLGMTLMTFRFLQVGWKVFTGQIDLIVANHEVEDTEKTIKTHPTGED